MIYAIGLYLIAGCIFASLTLDTNDTVPASVLNFIFVMICWLPLAFAIAWRER